MVLTPDQHHDNFVIQNIEIPLFYFLVSRRIIPSIFTSLASLPHVPIHLSISPFICPRSPAHPSLFPPLHHLLPSPSQAQDLDSSPTYSLEDDADGLWVDEDTGAVYLQEENDCEQECEVTAWASDGVHSVSAQIKASHMGRGRLLPGGPGWCLAAGRAWERGRRQEKERKKEGKRERKHVHVERY